MEPVAVAKDVVEHGPSGEMADGEKTVEKIHLESLPLGAAGSEDRESHENHESHDGAAEQQKKTNAVCVPGPDELKFRPLVLQQWFLILVISFNLVILALLVVVWVKPKFGLLNEWAYFVLQIFPTIIGTITNATLEAIVTSLSRITPFIRCVRPEGDVARTSLFLPYIPLLSLWASLESKNWILFWANLILWLGYPVLGLKAALLSASIDDGVAEVTTWALYALFAAYLAITIFIVCVAIYLPRRQTGLREGWDTVNIADHLVLFRKSDFLDDFRGSCIATRDSMTAKLGGMRVKLGYWREEGDDEVWHGFKAVELAEGLPPLENDATQELTLERLSELRFNSVFSVMKRNPVIVSTSVAGLILIGYVAALVLGSMQSTRNTFNLGVSPGISAFLLNFLLTFVLSVYSIFWEDVYLFSAITEPYVEMGKPGGATADQALLLNYASLPRPIAIFDAATRGHWKVTRTASVAMLQRLLPIIAGASITVSSRDHDLNGSGSTIQLSTPLSIITIVYLAVYLLLIPYEVLESGYNRHLPRDSLTIGDLLSWTCSSPILRQDHINLDPDRPETGLLEGNPLDTSADGPRSQKWYMEARLRLAQLRFSFGMEIATAEDVNSEYTIGIKSSGADTPDLSRPLKGLRRRVANLADAEKGNMTGGGPYKISGSRRFTITSSSESNKNVSGMGGPIVGGDEIRSGVQDGEPEAW